MLVIEGVSAMTARNLFRLVLCTLVVWVFSIPVAAQQIAVGERLQVQVIDSDVLRNGQTFKLSAADIVRDMTTALVGAGINVVLTGSDAKLVITVGGYDSGPYLGFSKTAKMGVAYQLLRGGLPSGLPWNDSCEAKAEVDMRGSQERNVSAVYMCLNNLWLKLAIVLAGESAQIMVN
jgi:hypothetical protein